MQSEAQDLSVIDSIPVQIAVLDADGTIIQVNEAWKGWERENDCSELLPNGIGANFLELRRTTEGPWGKHAPAAYAGVRAVLDGEREKYTLEYPWYSPAGIYWFLLTVTPYKSERGGAIVTYLDLTERKLEELPQTSFDDILERSLNEIYTFDAKTLRFIRVNEGARRNLGYSMDELRELTPVDIKPEYTVDKFRAMLSALMEGTKEKLEFETVHLRKNKTTYPVEVHLQSGRLEGTPIFVAIILDITERRRAEEQQRLIQSTGEGIYGVNLDGNCTFCNNATLKLLGYGDEAALLGNNIHELIHHTRADGTHYPIEECALNGTLSTNERIRVDDDVFWRADGMRLPVEFWSYPITHDEEVVGRVVSFVDITERNDALALLRQSKESAEDAATTKSRFLAAASHDLRQPLQSLGLYLSVLERQLDQPRQLDVADKMRKSLETMGELLDALLDISKLDGNAVIVEKKDVRIQELLSRIVNDNIQQAELKGLQLKCIGEDHVVHTDPGLLASVIENFVTNAIRYTARGTVTIDCQPGDGVLRVAVNDTGVGIEENEIDNVFEEYYQLDNPVRDRRKGLGLGLAIVKRIAQLLDHSIEVNSEPGKGSTFSVLVPLGNIEYAEVYTLASATPPRRSDRMPIVLLIDDDPSIIDATSMLLEASGMEVHSALNGEDALAQVVAGVRPDVLVTDYRLPGDTGIKVIGRIRQATLADLPAVIMTGDTSAKEIVAANLSNCTVLHKPADTDRLVSLIEDLVA